MNFPLNAGLPVHHRRMLSDRKDITPASILTVIRKVSNISNHQSLDNYQDIESFQLLKLFSGMKVGNNHENRKIVSAAAASANQRFGTQKKPARLYIPAGNCGLYCFRFQAS